MRALRTTSVLLAALWAVPAASAADVLVLHVGKVLTMDASDAIHAPGMLVVEDGKITYAGSIEEREGLPPPVVALDTWAVPGFVDLHTHIHSGGFGDINDMVHAVNPELRAAPAYRPGNDAVVVGRAGGVTTLFGIPGSGTNMGGFGLMYKSRSTGGFHASVMRDPGGLKVAQDSNPQRRNSTDVGVTRAGMEWNLRDVADRALGAYRQGRRDPALENLSRVVSGDLPVLIHTAGSEGVVNTARMWKVKYGATAVISHGSFDGWKVAPALAALDIPVNHGPRTIDYYSSREGRIVGTGAEFVDAGVPLFSLNTDSGVIDEEYFFLQGSMSARYGADAYQMLRAITIRLSSTLPTELEASSRVRTRTSSSGTVPARPSLLRAFRLHRRGPRVRPLPRRSALLAEHLGTPAQSRAPQDLPPMILSPLLLLAPMAAAPAAPVQGDLFVIKAPRVELGDGEVMEHAVILVEDGEIVTMGQDLPIERGIPVVELEEGQVVMPGLVNPYSRYGMSGGGYNDSRPQVMASAELYPSAAYTAFLENGVTTVGQYPAGQGIPGQAVAVRPKGPRRR